MQHDRTLLFAVRIDVERVEALRQVEIDLVGAALPFAADRVAQDVLELGAVECTLAGIDGRRQFTVGLRLDALEHLGHDVFRPVPLFVRADPLFRTCRELDDEILEAEVAIDRQQELIDGHALGFELGLGAKDVGIVLREAAHAHEAVQRAGRLVAMHAAELAHPVGQLAVRPSAHA